MQSVSRVPPPGTGTYQLPNGYYNNQTSSVAPGGQVITASTAGGLRPAGAGSLPTTNLTDASGQAGAVQMAQFTQPAGPSSIESPNSSSNQNGSTASGQGFQASGQASGSFSDSSTESFDTSELHWQP